MKVEIRTHGIELSGSLRAHAERRLGFGLDWARYQVGKVMLRLSDINGPRGGNDKRCQLHIPLPGMRDVVIEDTDADLRIAHRHRSRRRPCRPHSRTEAFAAARIRSAADIALGAAPGFCLTPPSGVSNIQFNSIHRRLKWTS